MITPPLNVVFDFDGTIADTLGLAVEIVNGLSYNFGYKKVAHHDIPRLRSLSVRELLTEFNIPLLVLPRIVKAVHKELHARIREVLPLPGVIEAWKNLKNSGTPVGIATSNTTRNVLDFFSQHNLPPSDFVAASSGIFGKGRLLKRTLRARELPPERALYVGDEVRDIEAAREAGMKIVSVSWGYNTREALAAHQPDFLIDRPDELVKIIDSLSK